MKTTLFLILAAVMFACGSPNQQKAADFEGYWCNEQYYDALKKTRSPAETASSIGIGLVSVEMVNDTIVKGGYTDADQGELIEKDGNFFFKSFSYGDGIPISIVDGKLLVEQETLVRIDLPFNSFINEQTVAGTYKSDQGESIVLSADGLLTGFGHYGYYFVSNMPAPENTIIVGTDPQFINDDLQRFVWVIEGTKLLLYEAIPNESSMYEDRGGLKMILTKE